MKQVFLSLLLVLGITAYSQMAPNKASNMDMTDAMLYGDVKDAVTGEHIPFVNIVVEGTTIGTSTDATGHYMFTDLPVGNVTIVASSLGYKTQKQTVITKENKSAILNFVLEQDAIMTEQVVVSASRNAINRDDAPVIVSAITPKHLEAIESNSIADGLNFTPGLRVESNCQNCGFTQLRMNGLEGAYSQILVNSRPVFSGLAGVYGLEQIPAEMVEQVEVIRGGGSAIFGGNAIAGTVNIITKDPINNMFQVNAKGSAIGVGSKGSGNVAYGKSLNFNGAIVSDNRKSGLFVFGKYDEKDPWDANDDGFTELMKLKNTSAGFQAYYKPSDHSRLSFEYHNLSETRRGGNKLNMLLHEVDVAEAVDHNINSGGITYEVFTKPEDLDKLSVYVSAQHVERDSYYGADQDKNAYGYTTGLTSVAGAQYTSNYKQFLSAPGSLTLGFENLNDRIKDTKLGAEGNPNTLVANQEVNTVGFYAQYQFDLNRIKILLGARADSYRITDKSHEDGSLSGNSINPRANLLFDLTEKVQLRLTYSTGYRAPQIFDEDLHIEASEARRVEHKNSPDLIQEKSQSFSGSVRFKNQLGRWESELLIEGFYTKLFDPFVNEYKYDSISDVTWSIRKNGESATVYGTNIEWTLAPSRQLYMQLGGTIQKSLYTTEQEWGEDSLNTSKEILRTPGSYAYAIVNYEPNKKWSFSLSGNYTGTMYVPHLAGGYNKDGVEITSEELVKTKSFMVVNLKAVHTIKFGKQNYLDIYAGVKNIFNSYQDDFDYGATRDAGYVYGPIQPRTIYAGVKFKM